MADAADADLRKKKQEAHATPPPQKVIDDDDRQGREFRSLACLAILNLFPRFGGRNTARPGDSRLALVPFHSKRQRVETRSKTKERGACSRSTAISVRKESERDIRWANRSWELFREANRKKSAGARRSAADGDRSASAIPAPNEHDADWRGAARDSQRERWSEAIDEQGQGLTFGRTSNRRSRRHDPGAGWRRRVHRRRSIHRPIQHGQQQRPRLHSGRDFHRTRPIFLRHYKRPTATPTTPRVALAHRRATICCSPMFSSWRHDVGGSCGSALNGNRRRPIDADADAADADAAASAIDQWRPIRAASSVPSFHAPAATLATFPTVAIPWKIIANTVLSIRFGYQPCTWPWSLMTCKLIVYYFILIQASKCYWIDDGRISIQQETNKGKGKSSIVSRLFPTLLVYFTGWFLRQPNCGALY